MATVDPDDDNITRYVAQHYRYDPERNERRDGFLSAFDDQAEFEEFVAARGSDLRARQEAGKAEQSEHISGIVYEPGDRTRAQSERLLSRASDHGVWPKAGTRRTRRTVFRSLTSRAPTSRARGP